MRRLLFLYVGCLSSMLQAQNWQSMGPFHPDNLQDMLFLNPDTGFAVGGTIDYTRILKTTNGGTTWSYAVLPDHPLPYAIGQTSDGRLFCSGYEGKGLLSSNQGETWSPVDFGTSNWLMDWTETPNGTFVACGLNGTLLVANNPQGPWVGVGSQTQSWLLALGQSPLGKLWAVGANGVVLHSSNQGQTWERQEVEAPETLTAMAVLNEDTLFACGFQGLILRSYNGGQSWQRIRSGDQNLHDIHFFNPQNGLAVGDGIILRTTDGGTSWLLESYPLAHLKIQALTGFPNGLSYACGNGGLLLKNQAVFGLESFPKTLEFYPNPAFDHIVLPNQLGKPLRILDAQGKCWLNTTVPEHGRVSLATLPPGYYFLQSGKSTAGFLLNSVQE